MPPPLPSAQRLGLACRPMTDEDLPFVAALFESTRSELVAGWPEEMRRAFLAQQHDAQHRHYRAAYPDAEWLIVEREGEPIGRLYLDERDGALHVIDISLVPSARGSGLGGAILSDLIEAARQSGKSVSMHVDAANPALRLYGRLGFTLVEDKGAYLELVRKPPSRADQ